MKKKILFLLLCSLFVMLSGCGKEANHEYTISEFVKIHDQIYDDYDKETEYWTEEEHEEKGSELFIKKAMKYGFTENFEVTISGCIDKSLASKGYFQLSEKENQNKEYDKQTSMITCKTDDNNFILMDDYSIVKITGIFLTKDRPFLIDDSKFLSPDLSELKFENNIEDICTSSDLDFKELIQGKITHVSKISEYVPSDTLKAYENYDIFESNFEYSDYLLLLSDESESYSVPVFISLEDDKDTFNVGDNLAVYGMPENSMKLDDQFIWFHNSYFYNVFE